MEVPSCFYLRKHLMMRALLLPAAITLLSVTGCSKSGPASSCPLVLRGWSTARAGIPVHFISNNVTVEGRQIRWNGVVIDEQTLENYVRTTAKTRPLPFIIFDPQTSDCAYAARLRDLIDSNYPCSDGACGQGSRSAFDRAPYRQTTGSPG